MPLIRLFYTKHSLSQKEEAKMRKLRQNPDKVGEIKVRYDHKKEVFEKEFPSVNRAVQWAEGQKTEVSGFPMVYRDYITVFGACEARDGECCTRLENAFQAEQIEMDLR